MLLCINLSGARQRLAVAFFCVVSFARSVLGQASDAERFWNNPLNRALSSSNGAAFKVTGPFFRDQSGRIEKYTALRTFLQQSDRNRGFGSEFDLSEEEYAVNELLRRLVEQELDRDIKDGFLPLPGR